ncbi:hypothetical protein KP626_08735 [Christensenella sp. MSJ-20]|uniref:hypothetical protein n=1 Tax=Christensenella sp. MSJ-20 TaxID=2841518 RepID=UPI001C74AEF0|nr:hypothetical protein KP626_08735 [Christensenella sp. MSJ-20]
MNPRVDGYFCARWAVDEACDTPSGISAGIHMALGFVADWLGERQAFAIAKRMNCVWSWIRMRIRFPR